MQKATRLTATQRNRALGRLRTFTVGTALASAAATGAFGYLAVMTDPGQQATDGTATTTTTALTEEVSDSTTSSSSSSATSAPTATSGLQSATTAPTTTTTRHAHVSSGGS